MVFLSAGPSKYYSSKKVLSPHFSQKLPQLASQAEIYTNIRKGSCLILWSILIFIMIIILVFTLEKSLPSSLSHGIFFQFARLKLVLLKSHIRREFIDIIFFMFGAGNKKFRWFMPPSLKICWAWWARSCVDLVWIVLSCQATQAERPDSLTQSKPNPDMVL